LDDNIRIDALHADVVAVARGQIRFVQARTAEHLRINDLDVVQLLPVVLWVCGAEQTYSWPTQGYGDVHWARVVCEHAGSAIDQGDEFS
jgi:hypothetical protein